MKTYERSPLLLGIAGFAAALATVGTLGVAILVPANLGPAASGVANASAHVAAPMEMAARYRIEVIGSRKANSA